MDERTRRNLDRVDEINAELAAREPTELWQPPPAPERRPVAQPTPRPAPTARDWQAERRWIEGIIDRRLDSFAKSIAEAEAEIVKEERAALWREIEARIAKSDSATVELILDLERRIAELERRAPPAKPRLVAGGSDAA